ncbi:MAG TPA: glycosyltransferase family 4 protein [Blastocatellia bacterium]|nr:glycosyltransferase family 4 protein [Blastocatellia bacterium]HMV82089.1 glycosyltransferase family 4 protein [Blastocatellia bacterium]HNG34507.1 glycosyltransferase family 4 protein [Blastocatellia bacterium]
MKLLMLLPAQARGGAEEQSLTIARAAALRGWQVHVALPPLPETASLRQDFTTAGAVCHSPAIAETPARWRHLADLKRMLRTIAALLAIKPDVALIALPSLIAGASSILACGLLRVPTAVVFHSTPGRVSFGRRLKAYAWARARNQQWIAVCDYSRELIRQSFETAPNEVLRIYNGAGTRGTDFSLSASARQNLCLELGLNESDCLILTVGRLHPDKGYRDLLHTIPHLLAEFPNAKFLWAGEGEFRQTLTEEINQYGVADAVRLLGHRADVPQLMQAADVLAFPSHVEAMSLVLLEAMAAGLPLVASRVGGTPELITDQIHGRLCHTGDSCDLLATLRWALQHPQQMREMAARAKERVREFSEERMIEETLAVLQRLSRGEAGCADKSSVLFPS